MAKPSRQTITRRESLARGAAAVGSAVLACDAMARGAQLTTDLIDAHVHVWTPDVQAYPLAPGYTVADMKPASFTPEQLMEHAAPCGVKRVVLIQMSFYGFDNRYMLDVIGRQPDIYRGVAVIDETANPRQKMRELSTHGVRGFRIQPGKRDPADWLRGTGMKEMWSAGADQGLAMCHLINPIHLPSVAAMCRDYPMTPVVVDHFARVGIDGQFSTEDVDALCRLAEFDHVRVKVSAFYALGRKQPPYRDLAPVITRLLSVFGRERLMWASDCPYQVQEQHTYRASVDLLQKELGFLSHEDREWLLRKTAEQLFFQA